MTFVPAPSVGVPDGLDEVVNLGRYVWAELEVSPVGVAHVVLDVTLTAGEDARVPNTLLVVDHVGCAEDAAETDVAGRTAFERARFELETLPRDGFIAGRRWDL